MGNLVHFLRVFCPQILIVSLQLLGDWVVPFALLLLMILLVRDLKFELGRLSLHLLLLAGWLMHKWHGLQTFLFVTRVGLLEPVGRFLEVDGLFVAGYVGVKVQSCASRLPLGARRWS